METYQEKFREMLRKARVATGYTQEAVAQALGVVRSTYTYYETGKCLPDLITLKKIAAVFDMPLEVFLHPEKFPKVTAGMRPSKKVSLNPEKIGDLSPKEKKFIAALRVCRKNAGHSLP